MNFYSAVGDAFGEPRWMQLGVWVPWTTFSRSVPDSYAFHKPGSSEKLCNYRVERLFIDLSGHRLCSWMSVAFVRTV